MGGSKLQRFMHAHADLALLFQVVNHSGVQPATQAKILGVHLPYFPYWLDVFVGGPQSESWCCSVPNILEHNNLCASVCQRIMDIYCFIQ